MICVIATVKTKPGHRTEFLQHFNDNVPAVLEEAGCIEYFPTIDTAANLEIQSTDENEVVVIEKWESVAALHDHLKAPHMNAYREKVGDIVESVSLKVLEQA